MWYTDDMDKNRKSVYIESTIPSYATARGSANPLNLLRQAQTRAFWDKERHKYDLYVSEYVVEECKDGDNNAAQRRLNFITGLPVLQKSAEVEELAAIYQKLLRIPDRTKTDCSHLASCVLTHIDYLLTWNCKHLGSEAQRRVQIYNDQHGLWPPVLVTPETIYRTEEKDYE
jgi:hypothetical protein